MSLLLGCAWSGAVLVPVNSAVRGPGPGLRLEPETIEPDELLPLLAERGVLAMEWDTTRIRFVAHRLIGDAEVARAAEVVAAVVTEHATRV